MFFNVVFVLYISVLKFFFILCSCLVYIFILTYCKLKKELGECCEKLVCEFS